MRGQWSQLIILMLAIGAPAISWVFGKLREQAELKKARDKARRHHEDSLRSTNLVDRTSPEQTPQAKQERERQDLAARRQAQLRELRQRQYERARPAPVVVRGPGSAGPGGVQTPGVPGQRAPGPLRPNAPVRPTPRRPAPQAVPQRRPAARQAVPVRPVPVPGVRRSAPVITPPRPERGPESSSSGSISATEIGSGRAISAMRGPTGVGADVRAMLIGPDGRPRPRAELAKAFALMEALSPPIALRSGNDHSWSAM